MPAMIINPGIVSPQKTVVIIGIQRGGTSMVAGVARELGVNLGKNLGVNHEDPAFVTKDLSAIRAAIQERNDQSDLWGWKMPHTSEYLLDLLPSIRNPHVIVVFRNVLAITRTQMRRSDADFETAFKFASERTRQVGSIVPEIDAPLMVVDFEKAAAARAEFVSELVEFLHLQPGEATMAKALAMIDPASGYRRVSHEDWRYKVVDAVDGLEPLPAKRKGNSLTETGGDILPWKNGVPFITFAGIDRQSVRLGVELVGEPDSVKVVVNVGAGFSGLMREFIKLKAGPNIVEITAPRISGIRVFPDATGGKSNIRDVRLYG